MYDSIGGKKVSVLKDVWTGYRDSTVNQVYKVCNCIGPDQCKDTNCELVKRYQASHRGNAALNRSGR
jgi:hypothetical protein